MKTLLHYACHACNNKEAISFLIEKGADIKSKDNISFFFFKGILYEGNTPFMKACENSNVGIVALFLDKGAEVNSYNNNRDFY